MTRKGMRPTHEEDRFRCRAVPSGRRHVALVTPGGTPGAVPLRCRSPSFSLHLPLVRSVDAGIAAAGAALCRVRPGCCLPAGLPGRALPARRQGDRCRRPRCPVPHQRVALVARQSRPADDLARLRGHHGRHPARRRLGCRPGRLDVRLRPRASRDHPRQASLQRSHARRLGGSCGRGLPRARRRRRARGQGLPRRPRPHRRGRPGPVCRQRRTRRDHRRPLEPGLPARCLPGHDGALRPVVPRLRVVRRLARGPVGPGAASGRQRRSSFCCRCSLRGGPTRSTPRSSGRTTAPSAR